MLNEMRFGELQPETILAFQSLSRKVQYTDGIEPTELYAGLPPTPFSLLTSTQVFNEARGSVRELKPP